MKRIKRTILLLAAIAFVLNCQAQPLLSPRKEVWSLPKANSWYTNLSWMRGCTFIPSSSVNQLEMWQAESFDPATIDRELGWAAVTGFNTIRVFLHHAVWEADSAGFKSRINKYLTIANSHGISTIFVLFEDCGNAIYKTGKQPDAKPGIYKSGWLRDPGDLFYTNPSTVSILERYVKDILHYFAKDNRIVMWDLYNEPGNSGYGNRSMPLLKNVFYWARQINPSQPLTSGVWTQSLSDIYNFQVKNSDVISYHNYSDEIKHKQCIDSLRHYYRPLLCTEYIDRKRNSRFENIMPLLKKEKIAAISQGLVEGKTNAKYAWDEPITDGSEPKLWYHEIFHKDGTPYKKEEINFIKKLTSK